MQVQFYGIDDWSRPVFKVVDKKLFIGSVDHLVDYGDTEEEIFNYFKDNLNELVYFGTTFNCEPDGSKINAELELLFNEQKKV